MNKQEFGEKVPQPEPVEMVIIQIGGELVQVKPETAVAYHEMLSEHQKGKLTLGQGLFVGALVISLLGPLAIWLYRIALGV